MTDTLRSPRSLGLFIFLALSVVCPPVYGAPESETKTTAKTEIRSERMTVRNKDRQAVFEGKVVLTRGSLVVRSDVMVVFYKDRNETGVGSRSGSEVGQDDSQNSSVSVQRIEATGKVRIEKQDGRATCQKAIYYQDEQKIVLTGEPVAWQRGNRVTGERITMFLEQDRTIVEGGSRLMLEEEGAQN